jgi:hypothetical protein
VPIVRVFRLLHEVISFSAIKWHMYRTQQLTFLAPKKFPFTLKYVQKKKLYNGFLVLCLRGITFPSIYIFMTNLTTLSVAQTT